jgi:membrane protein implicated in regulation of membrane protease activity
VVIITAFVVAYFFLEPPWRWWILLPAVIIESLDIIVWLRWRKKRSIAGEEGLVGTKGSVVSSEGPEHVIVKAKGQLWRAESSAPVEKMDEVVITGLEGIRLKVAPVEVDDSEVTEGPR